MAKKCACKAPCKKPEKEELPESKDPIDIINDVITRNEGLLKGSYNALSQIEKDVVLMIAASHAVLKYTTQIERKLAQMVAAQEEAAQSAGARVEVLDFGSAKPKKGKKK